MCIVEVLIEHSVKTHQKVPVSIEGMLADALEASLPLDTNIAKKNSGNRGLMWEG